ncbi:MBL fold metallo-hydrolase, partial [Patescibacteria group bacterium]
MFNRKIAYLFLVGLLVLALILGWMLYDSFRLQALQIIFLDVGQGDAILIQQGSSQVLIDGGRSGKQLLEKVGQYVPFWDRTIEVVVATHPDQDHIGGLVDLFDAYHVDSIMRTRDTSDSQTFKAFVAATQGADEIEAVRGAKIDFPAGAESEVLYPFNSVVESNKNDSNSNSVVLRLTWGNNAFLFTGDLPSADENKLIDNSVNIQANVLKVSHHGSRY